MKQFFTTLFGGLLAFALGVFIVSGIKFVFGVVYQNITVAEQNDGTFVEGLKRVVRYTATEEEDMFGAAIMSLPLSKSEQITAKSYFVKNLTDSKSVLSLEPDRIYPIASLTKLVTAVVARQQIDPDKRITISKRIISTYGNTAGFKEGEMFLANDLIYPLLMVSSNDAAEALAYSYGREKFVKEMNDFTQSIGAYRTYFQDPSGLSAKNVSTANDLAIILDWIRKNDPEIFSITLLRKKTVRDHNWVNPTHFLSWSNYAGGKNGYIPESDRTAASLFKIGKNNDMYAVVLLGSKSRDADELSLLKKVTE